MLEIRERMMQRGDQLCASVLSLGELLVAPQRRNDETTLRDLQRLFRSPAIEVLPVSHEAAAIYGHIRATTATGSLDAFHRAVAGAAGVNLFLTNDRRLTRHRVPGIDFIATLDAGLY
ncbi:MAG: type II toxin-antitoxin system VapC family toxin [Terriglobales bacterium]